MTARRPADIATDLRKWRNVVGTLSVNYGLRDIADELDALDRRWPTADEIAEMRGIATTLERRIGWDEGAAARLVVAFLDKLDPPPEPQADDDDVDPWEILRQLRSRTNRLSADDYDALCRYADAAIASRAALDARHAQHDTTEGEPT